MLSRAKLIEMAKDMGINPYHLEKDYVLTLICQQISDDPELYNNLILKGGLALHHIYGSARVSVDLDFTGRKRIEVEFILDTIEAVADLRITAPETIPATRFSLRIRPISYLGPLGVRGNVEIEISYREEAVPTLSYNTSTINDLIPIKFKLVAGGWNRSRLFGHIQDIETLWDTHLSGLLLEACPPFDEAVDVVARELGFLRK